MDERPDEWAEKSLEYYDQPAVREIVRAAAVQDYRWSAIILGIVKSPAFLRSSPRSDSGSKLTKLN